MYYRCKIRFTGEDRVDDVVIKRLDDFDEQDDKVFFYGLSREKIEDAVKNETLIEGEWQILELIEEFDEL